MSPLTPRLLAVTAVALVAPFLVACTPASDDAAPPTGCAASVREASLAVEPDTQVDLLDTALLACSSYGAFSSEIARYPGIIGYDVDTFLSLRCVRSDDDQVRRTAACATQVAPPTTPPPSIETELVYVGDTLDGRRIEIRPSARIEFEGAVPAVVQQTVDIAVEAGCAGVIEQRDLWASRIDDPEIGDEASVFAQHAQNVADYIQCDSPPLPGADAEDDGNA